MKITRQRRTPSAPPSEDLRFEVDDLLDLPLAPGGALVQRDAAGGAPPSEAPAGRRRRRVWPWLVVAVLALAAGGAAGYYLNLSPPLAELSTKILDFGEIRLGTPAGELAFDLGNRGEKVLAVEAVRLAGEALGDYLVTADGCSGREVAPRGSCNLRVAFTPGFLGPRRARLDLVTNAVNGLESLPLLGQGVAPELRAEPSRLDFGEAVLGAAGPVVRLEVSNAGSAALTLRRIELTGLGAADFIVLADACGEQVLAPGDGCSVRYRFVPTAEGLRRARVEIGSDAPPPASPPWLVGVGLPREPLLRLEPERLEFGEWLVGTASPGREVTVRNEGDGPLVIRRWAPSVAEVVPAGAGGPPMPARASAGDRLSPENDLPPEHDALDVGFEILEDGCSDRTVAPGGECAVEIRFRPRREGEAHGFFEIEHSARQGAHAVAVSGTGTAPRADVDPPRLSFGEVPVADRSRPRVARLVNSGSGPLEVGAVVVEGPDRQAFSPPASRCAGAVLAAGASCAVEVRFRPRRDGPHRAELVLRHTAAGGALRLPLNGLGVSARLVAEPGRLDFGVLRGTPGRPARLVLRNRGRAAVEIRGLRLDGSSADAFALRDDGCRRKVLGPGESCAVTVRFVPRRPGSHDAVLRVDHGADGVREVAVTATVARDPQAVP